MRTSELSYTRWPFWYGDADERQPIILDNNGRAVSYRYETQERRSSKVQAIDT
jgi:hypothetical protein